MGTILKLVVAIVLGIRGAGMGINICPHAAVYSVLIDYCAVRLQVASKIVRHISGLLASLLQVLTVT